MKADKAIKLDTMENYIMKCIKNIDKELASISMEDYHTIYPFKEKFHSLSGAKNALMKILTGHNNPQSNPL